VTIGLALASVVSLPTKAAIVDDALQGLILELQALLDAGELACLVVIGEVKQGDRSFMHHWQTVTDRYRAVGLIERAKQIALTALDDVENEDRE
jgi:hypothetical protein